VREGRFRKDLLYRLNDAMIVAPPLRERGHDVLQLARHFLQRAAHEHGRPLPSISAEAERLLLRHSWPGNVRELEREMRRLAVEAAGREVRPDDLSADVRGPSPLPAGGLRAALEQYEKQLVRDALERHHGVQARAAAELGISRQALCAKLRKWGWLLQPA
jgi:Nif-specific regulatory protein